MVSAAKGAEDFYSIEHHASRKEGIEEAKDRDTAAARVSNFIILGIFGIKSGDFHPKNTEMGIFRSKIPQLARKFKKVQAKNL